MATLVGGFSTAELDKIENLFDTFLGEVNVDSFNQIGIDPDDNVIVGDRTGKTGKGAVNDTFTSTTKGTTYVGKLTDAGTDDEVRLDPYITVFTNAKYTLTGKEDSAVLFGTAAVALTGANGSNYLTGNDGKNTIDAKNGNDVVHGQDGNDSIIGGGGNDTLDGDNGNDTIKGDAATKGDAVGGADLIRGGDGNDSIEGGGGNDQLIGDVGNDTIKGGNGADTIFGDSSDTAEEATSGNDLLDGGIGDDVIFGGLGKDTLAGGVGNDELNGGDGKDKLVGDAGNDTLDGGTGADTLTGGAGSDTFVISADSGNDFIADFKFTTVTKKGVTTVTESDKIIVDGHAGDDEVFDTTDFTATEAFDGVLITFADGAGAVLIKGLTEDSNLFFNADEGFFTLNSLEDDADTTKVVIG